MLNRAQNAGRPFTELLQQYTTARFLHRLSRSPYADRFVLKGALMLRTMGLPAARPTMDIDLLGRMSNSPVEVGEVVRACLCMEVPDDGLVFDPKSVRSQTIALEATHSGVRVRFMGRLGKAKMHMQVDVGFGDVIVPISTRVELSASSAERRRRLRAIRARA